MPGTASYSVTKHAALSFAGWKRPPLIGCDGKIGGARRVVSANISRVEDTSLSLAHEHYPAASELVQGMERSGQMPPLHPGSFCGYTHRPGQLREEIEAAGLDVIDLVSVEGLAFALADLEERLADPAGRQLVLGTAEAIERVPELLGLGPHLLATARRQ
jgi:hypothetical protein